ncbi:LysR family transcriptional regulator [Pasteurellaceae bacterium 15-036681]|nr:LysR family transcriptional regulator [Pasteurellaceae bacterium 15-036681]
MKNIETKWLEDFLTLESCRNFSQAAEMRNLSQSAFSRRIFSLEEALGVKLFNRSSVPLQLTEEGRLFHSQTRNLLQQLQYNLDELHGQNKSSPNIKFAAAHSLSLSIMPKLVQKMSAQGENFIYSVEAIDVDQTVNTLIEGKSDFIFSFYDELLMQEPFLSIEVLKSKLYPVSALDQERKPLFDLTSDHFPLLNYTQNSYMGRLVNRKLSNYPELKPNTVFISSMSELLKNVALSKQGIAWLPEYSITEELKRHQLKILDHDEFVIPINAFIYRINTRLNNQAEQFWLMLKKHCSFESEKGK